MAAVPSVLIEVSTPLFGLALTGVARGETVSGMSGTPARILVVANRTAAAPRLLKAVEHRAAERPCRFTLLVPDVANARHADWTLDSARPLLARVAGATVGGLTGGPDPFTAVKDAVATGDRRVLCRRGQGGSRGSSSRGCERTDAGQLTPLSRSAAGR